MKGQLLGGRYQMTQVLAQGGFGQTYLAADTHRPGHPVCVVKKLHPTNQDPKLMPKIKLWFKNEAETLAKLGLHNQIPQLFAYFEQDGEFYLVEEYIPGKTLHDELELEPPWDSEQVILLLTDILEILKFVHSHGVIHRDVKPSNFIRRETDNKLVLIDFGIVKQIPTLDSHGQLISTIAVGTPSYMPLEQLFGYPQLNSDIYSVGIIGIQAASGLSAQKIRSMIAPNSPGAGIGSWRDRILISSAIADVLEKMVYPDYHQRYQTVEAVLSDLKNLGCYTNRVVTDCPVPSANATPLKIFNTKSSKRRKLLAWLPIGGIIATALASAFYYLPQLGAQESALTLFKLLCGHSNSVWSVTLSADGQTLASGSEDKTIKIWHPNTMQPGHTLNADSNVRAVSLSADGQTLASGGADSSLEIWQPQTGELRYTLVGHSLPVWTVSLSRDGQTLVSGSEDKTIKIWNVQTGKLVRTLSGHSGTVYSVALTPDGVTLISGSEDKTIKIWNLRDGKLLYTLKEHSGAVRSVAVSPDGQKLVSGSWDHTIKIWNLRDGKLLHTIKGHDDRVFAVTFCFDGQTVASASLDKTVKIWDVRTGELRQSLSGHSNWVLSITASSWGPTIISGSRDNTIRIWQ